MSQIMKTYLGLFLILLMAVTELGVLSVFSTAMQAQNLHAQIICELENSAFNEGVLQRCYEKAEEKDCELEVSLYHENGSGPVYMAKVTLEYPIRIRFFGIEKQETLCGYAR